MTPRDNDGERDAEGSDKDLGLNSNISRRDFLNGLAVGIGALGSLSTADLLRAGIYGHLDPTSLGAQLRSAGIVPASVHCPRENRSMVGVKIDQVTDQLPADLIDAG